MRRGEERKGKERRGEERRGNERKRKERENCKREAPPYNFVEDGVEGEELVGGVLVEDGGHHGWQ